MTKTKKKKTYIVNIDMTWSEDVRVKASTHAEARKLAWAKFAKRPPRRNFGFLVDEAL